MEQEVDSSNGQQQKRQVVQGCGRWPVNVRYAYSNGE